MSIERVTYGCLFCRSGSEERIIKELKNSNPEISCISPKRERVRRQGEKEIVTLFPGYILFKTRSENSIDRITRKEDIYRLLRYPNGGWELFGNDLDTATILFEMGSIVRTSSARFDGNRVVMINGPLKEFENNIRQINKRAKTAKIEIEFHGKTLSVWLGFEVI